MLKSLKIVLALAVLASIMIGCAPTAEAPAANKDVSTGEMPDKLKGTTSESAGGGGGAKSAEEPASSPN